MKTLLATVLSVALIGTGAYAQSSSNSSKNTSLPGYKNKPSGTRIAAPNRSRAYGVNQNGKKVNPDEVPALSPGGQELAPEAR